MWSSIWEKNYKKKKTIHLQKNTHRHNKSKCTNFIEQVKVCTGADFGVRKMEVTDQRGSEKKEDRIKVKWSKMEVAVVQHFLHTTPCSQLFSNLWKAFHTCSKFAEASPWVIPIHKRQTGTHLAVGNSTLLQTLQKAHDVHRGWQWHWIDNIFTAAFHCSRRNPVTLHIWLHFSTFFLNFASIL